MSVPCVYSMPAHISMTRPSVLSHYLDSLTVEGAAEKALPNDFADGENLHGNQVVYGRNLSPG